jgi:hypothetical protein
MTHDYKRHGTTSLFAALDILEGKVIGRCMKRHRHQEPVGWVERSETHRHRDLICCRAHDQLPAQLRSRRHFLLHR